MQNLVYDVIVGRDFLQRNGALIDLVDSTLSFKGTRYDGAQASTKAVPVMGAFLSQQKLKEKKAVPSAANLAPFPEILEFKFVQRNEKSKTDVFSPVTSTFAAHCPTMHTYSQLHTRRTRKTRTSPLFRNCPNSSPKTPQILSLKMAT